jgi:hypothetical protein
MGNTFLYFLSPIFIGIGATLMFDLWALFLKHVFKIAPSNFCLVGRWIRYILQGTFRHSNIGSAPQQCGECRVGWTAHYVIGVMLTLVFVACAGKSWIQHPTLIPAVGFGIITVGAPFLIMQPALGVGIAASKTSNPMQARLRSLINHIVFGIGLYLSGLAVNWFL